MMRYVVIVLAGAFFVWVAVLILKDGGVIQ